MTKQENSGSEENSGKQEQSNHSDIKTESPENSDENSGKEDNTDKNTDSSTKISELNDKYLRLYSEFDNYRKRTIKEKADIIKTAGEDVFKVLLPVIDDFERAIKANEAVEDIELIKEGIHLIYNKLKNGVQHKGLTSFESIGNCFDADTMEAITHIPAQRDDQKVK